MSARTHDYLERRWGHSYEITNVIDGGKRLRIGGWGHGVERGDFLMMRNGDGETRYRVTKIEYQRDPSDMWFADVSFAPRGLWAKAATP